MTLIQKKTHEYHSLVLALLFVFFDSVIHATMLLPFRLVKLGRHNLQIRHLEIYLGITTTAIVGLILLSFNREVVGWLLVGLGVLRILQIISLNAMTLLFGQGLLSPEVHDRDRTRWHFVAILFSVADLLLLYGFFNFFFNRLYRILNIPAERFFDHFYYSMTTMTTVGYGDIFPITLLGKALALSEIFMGVFLFVFLVNAAMSRFQRHLE